MKFYYKGQLIRTSKTHAYNWAILTERPDGTYACHGCRVNRSDADSEASRLSRRGVDHIIIAPLEQRGGDCMNAKAIRQLADVTLDKYRSSIPRKAFEEFVKDIIAGENRATAFRYEASPICRASFPSTLDEDGARCTVEVTVYRLNAVAATAFLLDGPETLLRHIGLDERDTYTTKHEIDDLVTVVHITREEAPAWQH